MRRVGAGVAGALLVTLVIGVAARSAAPRHEGPARPQRIVSMNLCTDQLLMELVEPERIAAVSYLARDASASALADKAQGLPINHAVAEEVLALEPDLVLAGVYTTRPTVALLERLGVRVVEFEPELSLEDIRRNLRLMGEAVGESERAEALIADFDRTLAALDGEAAREGALAVFTTYGANGLVAGAGTLEADVAHAAGYVTLGERLGVAGLRNVSLEQLIVSAPDVVAPARPGERLPSLADQGLSHPALRRFLAGRSVVDVPDALWTCGTTRTLEAVALLEAAQHGRGGE